MMKREQKSRSAKYLNKFWKIKIVIMMRQILGIAINQRRIAHRSMVILQLLVSTKQAEVTEICRNQRTKFAS